MIISSCFQDGTLHRDIYGRTKMDFILDVADLKTAHTENTTPATGDNTPKQVRFSKQTRHRSGKQRSKERCFVSNHSYPNLSKQENFAWKNHPFMHLPPPVMFTNGPRGAFDDQKSFTSNLTLDHVTSGILRRREQRRKKLRNCCQALCFILLLASFLLIIVVVSIYLTRGKNYFGAL